MAGSSKVKIAGFSVSLDGYGAAPSQSMGDSLGVGGMVLHAWLFPTRAFKAMHGSEEPGATTGVDNAFAQQAGEGIGAWIMGRNMFGPVRGTWDGGEWKGWWGPNPVYRCRVFVLTHYARPPLVMEGGTIFIFVTEGIESALKQAREAAGGKDIRIGGGVATARQFLRAGLIDEMHLAFVPVMLGHGENLLEGLRLPELGLEVVEHKHGEGALHVTLKRTR